MNDILSDKKELKKQHIINNARTVFSEKGFIAVTMKDLIEESQISRGGIYLYFSDVEEVFLAVLNDRSRYRFRIIYEMIDKNESFDSVISEYLKIHKDRLLNDLDTSLLRATYEYYFINKSYETKKIQNKQLHESKQNIEAIFCLGIKNKEIENRPVLDIIINQYILVIEGLSILALTNYIDSQLIDEQFNLLLSLNELLRKDKNTSL